ncbi:Protein CBG01319 [Caenorhabditis briggsae]|uniref:Protein CBG01319 n=1 Tax=Caenorhabditis briggsae TaxID=6238 RepID=A8WQ48_CAEBR|nr:Protein CBG01319 [Caenorhabditis briggsae]CAP22606.2 Protein CBG01319 [Caenorhabditis briggsae]
MEDYIAVVLITCFVTVSGILSNTYVFLAARKMSSMRSSFGTITKNQTICNSMMCFCFLLIVPVQFGFFTSPIRFTHFVGTTAMTSYEISNLSHLLISVNRLCAVYLPSHYEKFFSIRKTKFMILTIWLTCSWNQDVENSKTARTEFHPTDVFPRIERYHWSNHLLSHRSYFDKSCHHICSRIVMGIHACCGGRNYHTIE